MAVLGRQRQNRYNPMGLRRDHRGKLLDKWGREMEPDWSEFEKKRLKPGDPLQSPKVLNPLHQATVPVRHESSARAFIRSVKPKVRPLTTTSAKEGMRVVVIGPSHGHIYSRGQTGRIIEHPYCNDYNWADVQFDNPISAQNSFPFRLDELGVHSPEESKALARAMLEGDVPSGQSPREFLKKLGKMRPKVRLAWDEFDDMEEWAQVAANELVDEIEGEFDPETDNPDERTTELELTSTNVGWFVVSSRNREYKVFKDDEVAHEYAVLYVRDMIEDQPETFTQSWLEGFIDTNHLRDQLYSDESSMVDERFHEDHPSYEDKRDFLIDEGDLDRDDFYAMQTDEDGDEVEVELEIEGELESKIDKAIEDWVEKTTNSMLEDPVEYLKDMLGKEDGVKRAMEIGGIDYDAAAQEAVSTDGAAHFLAYYDNNENNLPSGAVYYRTQ